MPFSHDTGVFNVQSSLVAWLQAQLTANKPPLIATVVLVLQAPESPLACPCWSVHFAGPENVANRYMGKNTNSGKHGARRMGLMEVSCWASRQSTNWRAQLMQMQDAVTKAVNTVSSVTIYDFYTSTTAPAALPYRVTIEEADIRQPPVDPNPDIERVRILIPHSWVEQA